MSPRGFKKRQEVDPAWPPVRARLAAQKSMGGQAMRMRVAAVYPDGSSAGLGCVERLSPHRTEIKKPVMDWLDGRQARLYCAGRKG